MTHHPFRIRNAVEHGAFKIDIETVIKVENHYGLDDIVHALGHVLYLQLEIWPGFPENLLETL